MSTKFPGFLATQGDLKTDEHKKEQNQSTTATQVEDQVSKDDNAKNIQTIPDSDSESETYWEQKFLNNYKEILNLSKDSLMWTTKTEFYSILRRGFLIDNGQKVFAVDKHGNKCLMLSARATLVIDDKNSTWKFGKVLIITAGNRFRIKREIESKVLSPETTYAVYLVYKLPQDQLLLKAPLKTGYTGFAYLVCPRTLVVGQKLDENTYKTMNKPNKLDNISQQRSDGWMEVKVWEFHTKTTWKQSLWKILS
ncbi:kinase-like domain, phloem protein 2-like protein [Tanacetum coccineum]